MEQSGGPAASEAAGQSGSYVDPEEYEVKRRLPAKLPRGRGDVYVTLRTNFKAQLARCQNLLEEAGEAEVRVHGLGPAINRALNLALQLRRRGLGSLDTELNTASLSLTDDLLPLLDDGQQSTRQRHVSAVHIRVFKTLTPVPY